MKLIDMTGQRYGRLVVDHYVGNSKWLCRCDCGNETIVSRSHLVKGDTNSCGCLRNENIQNLRFKDLKGMRFGWLVADEYLGGGKWLCKCDCGNTKIVKSNWITSGRMLSCGCREFELRSKSHSTHAKSKDRLYSVFYNMKGRCYNPNNKAYENYGGRGIKICDEWLNDFMEFYNWAISTGYDHNAPSGQYTIERIDVNGDYCPDNCCWVSISEQQKNKRCHGGAKSKSVALVDDNGEIIECFNSIKDASYTCHVSRSNISRVCNGVRDNTNGMHFRFIDNA